MIEFEKIGFLLVAIAMSVFLLAGSYALVFSVISKGCQ
jgi:hypothetical protein